MAAIAFVVRVQRNPTALAVPVGGVEAFPLGDIYIWVPLGISVSAANISCWVCLLALLTAGLLALLMAALLARSPDMVARTAVVSRLGDTDSIVITDYYSTRVFSFREAWQAPPPRGA